MLLFELPWPPSVNNYKYSNHRLNKRAREFRADVLAAVCSQIGIPRMLTGRIQILINLHQPADKRDDVDLDNFVKQTQDALEAAKVFKNDNQIDRLVVQRCERIKYGKAVVGIADTEDKLCLEWLLGKT